MLQAPVKAWNSVCERCYAHTNVLAENLHFSGFSKHPLVDILSSLCALKSDYWDKEKITIL